jgi:hypothetical protein
MKLTPVLFVALGVLAGLAVASMIGADTFAMKVGLPTAA